MGICFAKFPEMERVWQVPVYENLPLIIDFELTPAQIADMKMRKIEVPFLDRNAKRVGGKDLIQFCGGVQEVDLGTYGETSKRYLDSIERLLRNGWKLRLYYDEMYKDFVRNIYPEKNLRQFEQSINFVASKFEEFFRVSKYRLDDHMDARKEIARSGYKDLEIVKNRFAQMKVTIKKAEEVKRLEAKMLPAPKENEVFELLCPEINSTRKIIYKIHQCVEDVAKHYDVSFTDNSRPEYKVFEEIEKQLANYKPTLPVPITPDAAPLPPPPSTPDLSRFERRHTVVEVGLDEVKPARRNTISFFEKFTISEDDYYALNHKERAQRRKDEEEGIKKALAEAEEKEEEEKKEKDDGIQDSRLPI